MDHTKEELKIIQENNYVLNNLFKLILKIEKQQELQAIQMDELQKITYEIQDKMNTNLKKIDDNMKEIDTDLADFEKEVDTMKSAMSNTTKTLMENREIFTKVMDKFIKYETDEITPRLDQITQAQHNINANSIILPTFERTIEQNRLWRLYSNNFRQNSSMNHSNLATQLSLLQKF
jgi:hypothetical protein